MYYIVGDSVSGFWCVHKRARVQIKQRWAAALSTTPGKPQQACTSTHPEGRHLLLHLRVGHHCLHLCHLLLHCWVLHLLFHCLHALACLPNKRQSALSRVPDIKQSVALGVSHAYC